MFINIIIYKQFKMADTYTNISIQFVFAVKNRSSLIEKSWREPLYQYITGTIQNYGHKLLRINGMSDHIHIFIGYNVNQLIPELIREIKTASNKYIRDNKFTRYKFEWQSGYGAFSYNFTDRENVINYIINQQLHHQKKTFRDEYMEMLREFEIEFKAPYLLDFFEDSFSDI